MSIIDCSEELVSDVDINAKYTEKGLSLSIYIDDQEFHFAVDYEDMALLMASDEIEYPDKVVERIASGFDHVAYFLRGSLGNGRQ